jgi:hypothetical protein
MTQAQHVAKLCRENHIIVIEKIGSRGRAFPKRHTVRIPPVKTDVTYALALHEIGHILGEQPKGRLAREAAAWRWAMDAAESWSAAMHGKMKHCLGFYASWSYRREERGGTVKASSEFWKLYRQGAA